MNNRKEAFRRWVVLLLFLSVMFFMEGKTNVGKLIISSILCGYYFFIGYKNHAENFLNSNKKYFGLISFCFLFYLLVLIAFYLLINKYLQVLPPLKEMFSDYSFLILYSLFGFIWVLFLLLISPFVFFLIQLVLKKIPEEKIIYIPDNYLWKVIPLTFFIKNLSEYLIFLFTYQDLFPLPFLFPLLILFYSLFSYLPLSDKYQARGQFIKKYLYISLIIIFIPYIHYFLIFLVNIMYDGFGFAFDYTNDPQNIFFTPSLLIIGMYGYVSLFLFIYVMFSLLIIGLIINKRLSLFKYTFIVCLYFVLINLFYNKINFTNNVNPELYDLKKVSIILPTKLYLFIPLLIALILHKLFTFKDSQPFHESWKFLEIKRNISLPAKFYRGTLLSFFILLFSSLLFTVYINYIGLFQLISSYVEPKAPLKKGQINAYDIMKELYTKRKSPPLKLKDSEGKEYPLGKESGGKWGYEFTSAEKGLFYKGWQVNKKYYDDFKKAADAGVFRLYPRNINWLKAPVPNFLNIREVARNYATHAEILVGEGKIKEAIDIGNMIIRFGAMLQTDGTMVQHMIGVAVKHIGINVYEMAFNNKNMNVEDMLYLNKSMKNILREGRNGNWDYEDAIGKNDEIPFRWPARISVLAPIAIPGVERAKHNLLSWNIKYDLIYLGSLCRLYHFKYGTYPKTPDDLIPEFILYWPKDPMFHKKYVLDSSENGFTIRTFKDLFIFGSSKKNKSDIENQIILIYPNQNNK